MNPPVVPHLWTCSDAACVPHEPLSVPSTLTVPIPPGSPSSSPPTEQLYKHTMRFSLSLKTYGPWREKWAKWVSKHNPDQHNDWLSDDHLEHFLISLEQKRATDPLIGSKSPKLLYGPSTVLVALASTNALRNCLGQPSFYYNKDFPCGISCETKQQT